MTDHDAERRARVETLLESQAYVMAYEDEASLFIPPGAEALRLAPLPGRLRPPLKNVAWHQAVLPGRCRAAGYDVLFLPAGNRRLPWHVPCPSVGTVHDLSSIHIAGKYDRGRLFYILHVLPRLARRLTHVVTISESSKRDLVEYAKVPADRISVIPLAADYDTYRPGDRESARAAVRAEWRVDAPYLLYISRLEHPGKNHVRLIRAFDRLKSHHDLPHKLVLAGSDWSGAEHIHRAAAEAVHGEDIVFTGFARNDMLPPLYHGADVFVFPSLYEGFGIPLLEAMACGIPVACADLSSLPEVGGDGPVYFDPYDEEAMEDALHRLLSDEALRAGCVDRGLARCRDFSWERTARETLAVLRRVGGRG